MTGTVIVGSAPPGVVSAYQATTPNPSAVVIPSSSTAPQVITQGSNATRLAAVTLPGEAGRINKGDKGDRGDKGEPGPSGVGANYSTNFAFGDATPLLLGLPFVGRRTELVRLDITTAFNGVGATLSIGTLENPGLLMDTNMNDPTQIAGFETAPTTSPQDSNIYLFIHPGDSASTGAGNILIRAN